MRITHIQSLLLSAGFVFLTAIIAVLVVSEIVTATKNYDPRWSVPSGETTEKDGDPGVRVRFTLNLENNGRVDDNIRITFAPVPEGWTVSVSPGEVTGLKSDRRETVLVTISITSPRDADARESIDVIITATSLKDTSTPPASSSRLLTYIVNQKYDLVLEPTPGAPTTRKVDPGSSVSFQLNLTNTGNGDDRISMIRVLPEGSTNWIVIFNSNQVNLKRDERTTLHIQITAPNSAVAGQVSIEIRATSRDGTTTDMQTIIPDVNYKPDFVVLPYGGHQKTVRPKESVSYGATIENKGNDQDNFKISIRPGPWQGEGWTATLDHLSITISRGGSVNLASLLRVNAPDGSADQEAMIIVEVTDSEQQIVKTLNTRSRIRQEYKPVISIVGGTAKPVDPGTDVTFTVEVLNDGNGEDEISLIIRHPDQAPGSWSSFSESSVTLGVRQKREVTLTVTPPSAASHLPEGYTLQILAVSEDLVTSSPIRSLKVNVNRDFGVSVTISGAGTRKASPGQTVEYSILVRNRGNVDDTIMLNLYGLDDSWKPGWGSVVSSVDLQRGASTTIPLVVNVPGDAVKDDYRIGVRGTSSDDPAIPKATGTAEVIVTVNQVYGIIITVPTSQKKVNVNSEVDFDIMIMNDGTGDDTITLAVVEQPAAWQVNFDRSTLQLGGKTSTWVRMTAQIPPREAHRAFNINFTATSQQSPPGSPVVRRGTVITTVNQTFEFNIDPSPDFTTTLPGKTVTFTIAFENKGTGSDRIRIGRGGDYPDTWTVGIASQVTVPEGGTISRPLTVYIGEETLKGEYHIRLTGTSMDDPRAPAFARTVTITISVEQRYNLSVSIGTDTRGVNPFPVGQTHTTVFTFTVSNTGTGVDSSVFAAAFETTPSRLTGWGVAFSPQTLDLGAKRSGTVSATVTVPSKENTGTYGITLTTISRGDASVRRSIRVWVQVNQTHGLDLLSDFNTRHVVPASMAGTLTEVSFTLSVRNTGTGTDKFYLSLAGLPTGWFMNLQGNTPDIPMGHQTQVPLTVKVPGRQTPRTYNLTVTAVSDGSGSVQRSIGLSVVVKELHSFELTCMEPTVKGDVSSYTHFTVILINRGTGTDTFKLDFIGVPKWLTVSFPDGTGTDPVVPGSQTSKQIRVFVEDGTPRERFSFRITAASNHDPGVTGQVILTIDVNQAYDLKAVLVGSPPMNRVGPGTTATYRWLVTNDGTGQDSVSVVIPGMIEGRPNIPSKWKVTPVPYNFDLAPGQSRNIVLEVEIDRDATPRTVHIQVFFIHHDNTRTLPRQITVIVNQTYNVATNLNLNLLQIFPGHHDTAILNVKNTGTGPDYYRIVASTFIGITPVVQTSLTDSIEPQDTIQVQIRFAVDGGLQPRIVKFWVNVTSQRASEKGVTVMATSSLDIRIKETFRVALARNEATLEVRPIHAGPGTATLALTVINEGSSRDTFNFDFALDPETQRYKRWITLPPSIVDLPAGAVQNVDVLISVPPWETDTDAFSDGKLRDLVFIVFSKGARDNNVEVPGSTTRAYLLHLNIREYFHAQFIAITPSALTMGVDDTAMVNVTLQNRGNSIAIFSFEKNGKAPDGRYTEWYGFLFTSRAVGPGQEVSVPILIKPRSDAPVGIHDLRFNAQAGEIYTTETRSFRLTIEEKFGGEFVSATPRASDPGKQVSFHISVRNTGNSVNRFFMDDPQLPEGWTAPIWQGGNQRDIPADSSGVFELRLNIPTDYTKAPAGHHRFEVTGRYSDRGGSQSTIPGSIPVGLMVNTMYGVQVTSDETAGRRARPGRSIQYQIRIQNTGNREETFQVTLLGPGQSGMGDGKDWTLVEGLTGSLQMTIVAGATRFLPVIIHIPLFVPGEDDAAMGLFGVRIKAESTNDSMKASEILFQFTVSEMFHIDLWSDNPRRTEILRENHWTELTYILNIRNLGNTRDTIIVSVPSDELSGSKRDWTARFGTQTSRTLELDSLAQGSLVLTIRIDRNTNPGTYQLQVRAESQGESTAFTFTTLHIELSKADYGLRLDTYPMAVRRVNPVDEAVVEFKFSLTNTGNQEDTYTVQVETPLGSGVYKDWTMEFEVRNGERRNRISVPRDLPGSTALTIARGGRVDITLRVIVDPGEEEGEYREITVSATSDHDNTRMQTLQFTLVVVRPNILVTNDPLDFRIHSARRLREGDDVEITVRIYNDGTAETGKFFVFFYNGRKDSPNLKPGNFISYETVENIPAGSYYDVLTVWYDIPAGKNDIHVHADKPIDAGEGRTFIKGKFSPDGLVLESRENDNWANIHEQFRNAIDLRPDLTVTTIDFDDRERKTTTTVTVTVVNVGSAKVPANSATVSLRIGGTPLSTKLSGQANPTIADEIDINDQVEIDFLWIIPDEKRNFTVRASVEHPDDSDNQNDRLNTWVHSQDASRRITGSESILFLAGLPVAFLVFILGMLGMKRKRKTAGRTGPGTTGSGRTGPGTTGPLSAESPRTGEDTMVESPEKKEGVRGKPGGPPTTPLRDVRSTPPGSGARPGMKPIGTDGPGKSAGRAAPKSGEMSAPSQGSAGSGRIRGKSGEAPPPTGDIGYTIPAPGSRPGPRAAVTGSVDTPSGTASSKPGEKTTPPRVNVRSPSVVPGAPAMKLRPCPSCRTPIPVPSDKRPLKLVCPKCGASGILNK